MRQKRGYTLRETPILNYKIIKSRWDRTWNIEVEVWVDREVQNKETVE